MIPRSDTDEYDTLSIIYFSCYYPHDELHKTLISFSSMILPTFAGILLRHGSYYLFLKRSEKSRNWPLHWTIPGGKIENNEDPLECAIRETLEEVGVKIQPHDILQEIIVHATYIDGEKTAYIYLIDTWEGMPDNLEPGLHDAFVWKTLDELPYPLIPHIRVGVE